MADVTPQAATITGTVLTATAASEGLTITNNGRSMRLIAVNSSGALRTFDIVTNQQVESDLDVEDREISLGASEIYTYIGTFSSTVYNDANGEITLQNFSSTTGVTILALQD